VGEIGSISLYIALVLGVYAAVGSVVGQMRHSPQLVESARHVTYLVPAVLGVSTLALVVAFLTHDFEIEYVFAHSSLSMNPAYTWVASYAGNEGSLLYIALVLAVMVAVAVALMPATLAQSTPYAIAIMMVVLVFLMGVMATLADPFDKLPIVPADGQGINPLLTHPGMFLHPPLLMAGLIGATIPFAIMSGQMLAGHRGDEWVDPARVWGLIVWLLLGAGVLLGAWWAYTILGWGGYWAWDPIENVGLMPWLVLTALLHSIMVQKRRGMFRMWNVVLMDIAFTLSLFGIFINRGGPVPSVHSFASSVLGWAFLAFLGIGAAFSIGVFFLRHSTLRSQASLDSMLSREAAFLLNNLLLVGITFVTLWGVVFPLVSQMFRGVTVTVLAPFYNQLNGPLLLALILLMGVGPLLPWRHASANSLRRALQTPGIVALGTVGLLLALRLTNPFALISFGLCALVASGILQEWVRGTRTRHRHGENYVLAFRRLLAANRPRYGGYVVHLAIVAIALGVTGSSFYGVQRDVILAPGEEVTVEGYTVQYIGARTVAWSDRTELFNDLLVTDSRGSVRRMTAWRASYPQLQMASTRAAIRSTPLEDLYIVSSESLNDGRAAFRILVNPLVWWMWLAGPVLLLGTLVALWPQRSVSLAPAPAIRRLATSPAEYD
jgi:cytochrome c-type biogenesis protein CcmF